jgi:hypothetical protein
MNKPRRPPLPETDVEVPPDRPHPLNRPDERKEGGPDFGKAEKQRENHEIAEEEVQEEAEKEEE